MEQYHYYCDKNNFLVYSIEAFLSLP
jgi:hypothetical protein